MSAEFGSGSVNAERLSSLVDGELEGTACAAACASWHTDAEARRTWHAYHLIGDVLRSEDLASSGDSDARFLVALRARLAAEPVVLAPAALASPASRPWLRRPTRWMLSSAIAAGFLLVVGTFTLLRPGGVTSVDGQGLTLAQGGSGIADASSLGQSALREPVETALVVDGKMIRDARLESYLAAHKQFAGTSALGVPSAFLRSATVNVEAR